MSNNLRHKIARIIMLDHLQLLSDFDVDGDLYRMYPECVAFAYSTADAIIAALPGLVKPLEWEGVESDCFVQCSVDGCYYDLCVVDTLERPCDYLWSVTYYVGRQRTWIMCGEPATFEAAKAAAQRHHVAQVMAAFGIEETT